MVLYNHKPVEPEPPKVEVPSLDSTVWYIPQTSEYFLRYDEYLERLDFYKRKVFSTELSGKNHLTYFGALNQELDDAHAAFQHFPEPLKEPVLRQVQFSTSNTLETLSNEVYDNLRNDFFPGELVIARIGEQLVQCVVREKATFNAITMPNGDIKPAYSRFRVQTIDPPNNELAVDDSQLSRDRSTFTKPLLRSFFRLTISREPWPGAPWIVKEEFASRYRIDKIVPANLRRKTPVDPPPPPPPARPGRKPNVAREGTNGEPLNVEYDALSGGIGPGGVSAHDFSQERPDLANGKRAIKLAPEPKLKPRVTEDLALPFVYEGARHRAPMKLPDFGTTVEDHTSITGLLLEAWVFLNVYSDPLILDAFTFDDFVDAIRLADTDNITSLLNEIHCALLSAIASPTRKELLITLPPEPEKESGLRNDDDDLSETEDEDVKKEPKQEDNGSIKDEKGSDNEEEDEEDEEEEEDEDEEEDDDENDKEYEDAKSDDETEDSGPRTHRASEFTRYQKMDWIDRLKKRMFRDGGWQQLVISVLDMVSYVDEWSDTCEKALEHMASLDRSVTLNSALDGYYEMPFELKVKVLDILCQLIHNSVLVRNYIDQCIEDSTKVRKEKTEKHREIRVLQEAIRSFEEGKKGYFPNGYPTPAPADSAEPSDKIREHLAESRRLKHEAEIELTRSNPEFKKLFASWEQTTGKLDDKVAEVRDLDRELLRLDCQRLRMLGKDRYHNRYWWFEYNGTKIAPEKKDGEEGAEEGDEDAEEEEEEDYPPYGMGRLWIQGPSIEDALVHLQYDPFKINGDQILTETPTGEIVSNETGRILIDNQGEVHTPLKPYERKRIEEGGAFLKDMNKWAYYESEQELNSLVDWLKYGGRREYKLLKELQSVKKRVSTSMLRREEHLKDDEATMKHNVRVQVRQEMVDEHGEEAWNEIMSEGDYDTEGESPPPENRRTSRSNKRRRSFDPVKLRESKRARIKELEEDSSSGMPDRVTSWANGRAIEKFGHSLYDTQRKRGPKKRR